MNILGRRSFLVGTGLAVACHEKVEDESRREPASSTPNQVESSVAASSASAQTPVALRPYPLFEAYPGLERELPRIAIGRIPSPVLAAENLTRLTGGGPIFIKRDDGMADAFGGGKVRKLELYFGDAIRKGKTSVVTFGGVGSNQAAAVALIGKTLGLTARLYLAPQPRSSLVTRNLGADASSGAELRLFPSVHEAEEAFALEAKNGDTSYPIGAGGTTPLGTLGFVSAGLELGNDVREGRLPEPKRIYIALGLGGSATGLAIGVALAGLSSEIVAVRASNPKTVTIDRVKAIHAETIAFARSLDKSFPDLPFAKLRVRIEGRFLGSGYGVPTEAGEHATSQARETEGWELDPVYTAKALAALISDASGASEGPNLFWSTQSSRPVSSSVLPKALRRFVETNG